MDCSREIYQKLRENRSLNEATEYSQYSVSTLDKQALESFILSTFPDYKQSTILNPSTTKEKQSQASKVSLSIKKFLSKELGISLQKGITYYSNSNKSDLITPYFSLVGNLLIAYSISVPMRDPVANIAIISEVFDISGLSEDDLNLKYRSTPYAIPGAKFIEGSRDTLSFKV